ncbi:hypothetical protein C2E25_04560 [Geothermobacter hydrogeniphilus]|uniref:Preprotein translocase subunit SecB n=1 Tax=Geothermobacter hydrogeniphilus TaxID=1969733 RepID=A0A2K2HC71_9BACT|nr:protein-export chaperone SecB [Geothermobacter hydrogeniphilus]PNU20867.1 hypothetical protein C2E25_04560 [Geothermobacter hydrogeniphilus]
MESKYEKLISGIEMEEIFLSSVKYKRSGTPDPEKYPEVRVSFTPEKASYKQKGNQLEVRQKFIFLLDEFEDGDQKPHKLFELKGEYALTYRSEAKMDDELFELFKARNIPVNLQPYIRELVQSSLTRVGLPPFTLPVLKIKR